ncbi:MAG: hypothetical protein K0S65_4465 [Labilithrix sp.]|nr:hypothetical protein [Labilithrix sp.]
MDGLRFSRAIVVAGTTIALGSSGALFAACRNDAPDKRVEGDGGRPAATAAVTEVEASAEDAAPRGLVDAGAEPTGAARVDDDAGGAPGARGCEGANIALLAAAVDPRCAISTREWTDLAHRADAGVRGVALRQEARRDGERIVVAIVNGRTTPVDVPLRFHPGHPELAFSVLAETEDHAVYELAPPSYDAPPPAAGSASLPEVDRQTGRPRRWGTLAELDAGAAYARVHTARIRIAPHGRASARLVIDPRIVKRLDRSCADAGAGSACLPPRLPRGSVVLYVGQLVAEGETGAPARVAWEAP